MHVLLIVLIVYPRPLYHVYAPSSNTREKKGGQYERKGR
jgi:hypothetical protein